MNRISILGKTVIVKKSILPKVFDSIEFYQVSTSVGRVKMSCCSINQDDALISILTLVKQKSPKQVGLDLRTGISPV